MAYYLSRVIGDGREPETAFRPAVTEYTRKWSAVDGRLDATKADGWMLVQCEPLKLPRGETRIKPADKAAFRELRIPDKGEATEREIAGTIARKLLETAKPAQQVRTKR